MATDSFIRPDTRQSRIQSFAFVISAGVCVLLGSCFAVSSLGGFGQSAEIELERRINPNDAPVGSLVRLPGVGMVRAGAIVAYRENFRPKNGNSAFRDCGDLQKVSGIGPKTVENIAEWLEFD